MCAPVVGAGRNGPYMEGGTREKGWNGMGFLFDCLVELPAPVLLLPLCFSGAKEKYTFSVLVALPAMIKMIEE